METVLVLLDPGKLNNPDLDLRYRIPDLVEQATGEAVKDGGYDYIDQEGAGPLMAIWLEAEDAGTAWKAVLDLFHMTPYYWKTPKSGAARLAALEALACTVSFRIHVFSREG